MKSHHFRNSRTIFRKVPARFFSTTHESLLRLHIHDLIVSVVAGNQKVKFYDNELGTKTGRCGCFCRAGELSLKIWPAGAPKLATSKIKYTQPHRNQIKILMLSCREDAEQWHPQNTLKILHNFRNRKVSDAL